MEGLRVNHSAPKRNPLYVMFFAWSQRCSCC